MMQSQLQYYRALYDVFVMALAGFLWLVCWVADGSKYRIGIRLDSLDSELIFQKFQTTPTAAAEPQLHFKLETQIERRIESNR